MKAQNLIALTVLALSITFSGNLNAKTAPGKPALTAAQLKQCDALMKQMIGKWSSENIFGEKKIITTMVVTPIVQNRYLECDIQVKNSTGKLIYESMMVTTLDHAMKKYLLYTFDNRGSVLQFFGDADPNEIVSQGFIPMAGVERYRWRFTDKNTLEQAHWKPSRSVIEPGTPPDETMVFHRVK